MHLSSCGWWYCVTPRRAAWAPAPRSHVGQDLPVVSVWYRATKYAAEPLSEATRSPL